MAEDGMMEEAAVEVAMDTNAAIEEATGMAVILPTAVIEDIALTARILGMELTPPTMDTVGMSAIPPTMDTVGMSAIPPTMDTGLMVGIAAIMATEDITVIITTTTGPGSRLAPAY